MSGGGGKQTVGYWYSLGFHVVLCQGGADAITKIEYADRTAWTGNVTGNTTITINKPSLLGGEKREGGLKGDVDVMFGGDTQVVNPYLAYHCNRPIVASYATYGFLGGVAGFISDMIANSFTDPNDKLNADGGIPVPAYRGLVSLVFKSFTYAAMNPYLKEMNVTVRRVPKGLNTTHATIILDGRYNANPAHIIYDVLTNKVWGLGFNASDINIASFTTAAQALYNENFGLSIAWTDEGTAEDFLNLITQHANAVLYPAPDTGQYTLKLIRADYVIADLPLLDPSNILNVRSFQRTATTDLVNEVTVQYRDPKQDKEAKVTVQNLAAIRMVKRVIRRVISLPGIRNGNLAARVAVRELQTLSTPLAKVTLEVNMTAWNLRPGDCFRFAWPKLGITQIIMRVIEVEYGDLRSGRITVTAMEDQFGLPNATYITPVAPAWVELPAGLTDIVGYKLAEIPYFAIIKAQGEDYATYLADNRNFVMALAARQNDLWTAFELHENISGAYTFLTSGVFSPWVLMTNAITRQPTDNVWSYNAFYEDEEVAVGDLGVIDNEWVQVVSIDTVLKTVTVERGVLDTIPETHAVGARLWLFFDEFAQDYSKERLSGESVTYKLLPVSGSDVLPIGSATARSIILAGRQQRPYPPGNVRLNGEYFPTSVVDDIAVTWTHRDRTVQTADPIPWSSGSVTLEAGATYTAQVYRNATNTLLHQQTGITTGTKTVTSTEIGDESDLRLELFTVRSSLESYQRFIHVFTRVTTTDAYSLRVFADAPLGFWRLGDAVGSTLARDASGNSRDGTPLGVTFGSAGLLSGGQTNKAGDFSGSGSYIEVPYAASLAPTVAITVELWVKFDAFSASNQSLISKTQTGGYSIHTDTTTGMIEFLAYRNGAYAEASFPRAGNMTTGVVYHLVGTFDGRYARIYLDGVLMATNDAGAIYPLQYSVNNSLVIGAEATATTGIDGSSPPIDGQFDEVSVYGVAIPASEVLARYKMGKNVLSYREDGFWDKTSLLLHMDGTNGSTTFTDAKGKTVTANGDAQISTAQSKFGSSSGLFDGSGDYLTVPQSTDLDANTDFTIEAWVRPTNFSARRTIASKYSGLTAGWEFGITTSGTITFTVATGSYQNVTSTASITANVWHHVAASKRGNTLRVFVNGVLSGAVTATGTVGVVSQVTYIGRDPLDLTRDWNGYIDDLRITKACRYAKAVDLPVEAFPEQSALAETSDPFWADKTVLLLHMNGTNGSTTFTDQKAHAVTANGNAQISTTQSKFGGAAALFDGTTDYLSLANHADFQFLTGDFTVEMYFRATTFVANARLIALGMYATAGNFALEMTSASVLVHINGGFTSYSLGTMTTNTWYHLAVARKNGIVYAFLDGALKASASQPGTVNSTGALSIGAQPDGTVSWNGYIDELRVTKAARYIDSFAVPKLPYPDA